MTDFDKKLIEWSTKVIDYAHGVATNPDLDMDLSFYAFQSPPKESPELLILGINPGREYSYVDQLNSPIWKLIDTKRMTTEMFLKGNPTFFDEHQKWKLWQNLSKSFIDEEMKTTLSSSMYMNYVYFNTKKIDNLLKRKGGREADETCRKFSLELISEIIKPKQILCLGTVGCFDKLPILDKEVLLGGKKRLLVKGSLLNIPIYGISHPSGSITSDEDRKRLGELLKQHFTSSY